MAGSKRLLNLASHLVQYNNTSVTNFVIGHEEKKGSNNDPSLSKINCVSIGYKITNPFSVISLNFKIFQNLRKAYSKSSKNILYNYGYPNIKNILTILSAKLIGYKIVFDIVEDNEAIQNYKSTLARIKIASSIFLIKRLRYYTNGAIGISQHLVELLKGYSKGKFKVLHLPISINRINFEISENAEDHRAQSSILKIFYGGSYGQKDGLGYLLKAFNNISTEYDNIELILTGKGSKRDMDEFYSMLNEIENRDRIKIMGFVSDEKYYHLLNSADIHCMTRTNSKFANAGFPFKLGEMLATGKPVIASNVGDVPNYLSNRNAVLVEPESISQLENALKELISSKEKAIQIGKEGRKTAFNNFDAELLTADLYKFLIEI
jgi:glycosyltransferase involved in cell wall biosynthesis